MTGFDGLIDDFLELHWRFHPVDASFMGEARFNHQLPPADETASASELTALQEIKARLNQVAVPDNAGARIDARYLRAQIAHAEAVLPHRPHQHNPAWYTGEAAFGLISLLLPGPHLADMAAFNARLTAIPAFLAQGRAHLANRATPADWCKRARLEAAALTRLLNQTIHLHPSAAQMNAHAAQAAVAALDQFTAALDGLPDRNPAAGHQILSVLIRNVHGLDETPESLEAKAQAAFVHALAHLEEKAAKLDPAKPWRQQLADLLSLHPPADSVVSAYRHWHDEAMAGASALVTPAKGYGLDYKLLPEWARDIAGDLYFLFYRSPMAFAPGTGSNYWVGAPGDDLGAYLRGQNIAAIKQIHAVHHGSIGHHTQNFRARAAQSRLARLAGTDCASGIAFLGAGTMVEGWPCYAEDLMDEVPGFYTDLERLQLAHFELRNIACCLADIRLHLGIWSLEQMRAFYRDEVNFAPARLWSETTRNSIFPGSRLMYWTGTDQIRNLRHELGWPAQVFHDRLLSYGSAPLAWIAEEMRNSSP